MSLLLSLASIKFGLAIIVLALVGFFILSGVSSYGWQFLRRGMIAYGCIFGIGGDMSELNETIHQPVRLRIMATLVTLDKNSELDFTYLRDLLG